MITYCGPGDMMQTKMDVIVIPVNTVGVMGCGIALWAKLKYPFIFESYRRLCKQGIYKIGDLALYKVSYNRWILLFPTKSEWSEKSELQYIEDGLIKLVGVYKELNIKSISFPALGCGYGELDFNRDVRPLMYRYLDPLPIPIEICLRSTKRKSA